MKAANDNFATYFQQLDDGDDTTAVGLDGHPYRTKTKFARSAEGQWVPVRPDEEPRKRVKQTPEQIAAARATRLVARTMTAVRTKAETKAMAKQVKRISTRQDIGDPMCAANDNENWPLLAFLRREQMVEAAALVLRYRQFNALCECQPLAGLDYGHTAGMAPVYRDKRLQGVKEVDAAAAEGWTRTQVPGGEIEYTRQIKKKRGVRSEPAIRKMATSIDEDLVTRTASLSMRFTDSLLVEQLDAKPVLAELRQALGPLLDPFEDAVLGGCTLADIGRKDGVGPRSAAGVGRAMVMRAIGALDTAWRRIDDRHRRTAA